MRKLRQIPPMTGTEDFGYVTTEVPGMFIFFGAGKPGSAPLHSPQMVLDEDVLPAGAAFMQMLRQDGSQNKAGRRTKKMSKNAEAKRGSVCPMYLSYFWRSCFWSLFCPI